MAEVVDLQRDPAEMEEVAGFVRSSVVFVWLSEFDASNRILPKGLFLQLQHQQQERLPLLLRGRS
jgi:hypothetical protein